MERSGGINNMRLPTSPMSFPSSNINIPGSLVLDGSASIQHLSPQQQQQAGQAAAVSTSVDPASGPRRKESSVVSFASAAETKTTTDSSILLQQQQLLRQQQGTQQIIPPIARKMMMYLYHPQQRPAENCITYWKKFVAEYFSPRANQRLCLSQYANAGKHALGMFPQASPDKWQCDLCGTKSGEGFEATFDVLARLNEIKFASGIIDELLYMDHPRENRFSNGLMLLEYRKAVQETVHEQFRVVREGHLRIIFSKDLKILSWEFCARRHEEFLLRRLIAPQVNQLLQVAQKCQTTISESGSEGVSQQDLKSNSNMVLGAGRQLAKFMELQSLNDLGYPKRYIRTLQISEVVKSMKDLMNFTGDHKLGPIEGLKRLLEQTATAKLQRQKMQEMEQLGNSGAIYGSSQAQMALTSGTMNDLTGNNNNSNQTLGGRVPSRNNSFTAASNNNLHLSKDVSVTELSHGFSDDGFFNNSDIYGSLKISEQNRGTSSLT
ncbi:BnaC01g41650D [Brassica napus]|uniref:BnaC01g41650D protein n=1 Tax=Brassica napus TaxID=3708 RepID=A0A078J2H3_BRANA|nr:BnaC01g41650D [Brassica napus]